MAISYNKLWKLLVDKKMSKADLRRANGKRNGHWEVLVRFHNCKRDQEHE